MSSKYYTEEQIDNLIAGIEAGNKENERLTQRIVELEAQLPAESGGTVGLDSGDGSTQRLVEIGERDLAELTRKAKAWGAEGRINDWCMKPPRFGRFHLCSAKNLDNTWSAGVYNENGIVLTGEAIMYAVSDKQSREQAIHELAELLGATAKGEQG